MASAMMFGKTFVFTQLKQFSPVKRSCALHIRNHSGCPMSTLSYTIFGDRPKKQRIDLKDGEDDTQIFEKKMLSLKGCAGIQTFRISLSKDETFCFLVAFRNYTIQMKKKSQNRVVVFFIDDYQPWHEMDVRYFNQLMQNEERKPIHIDNYRQDCQYTFRGIYASVATAIEMEYKNLRIVVSMTPNFASKIDIGVKCFKNAETH